MLKSRSVSLVLISLTCLAFSVNAQESPNGVAGTRVAQAAEARVLSAITVPTAGPWQEFLFGVTGSTATGCLSGGCAGPGANSVFADDPPWTFNAPAGGAVITVTDAFLAGDRFEIFDGGISLGTTSTVPTGPACGGDPDPCYANPAMSHGVFYVGPGARSLTIKAVNSPFGAGAAYFKIETAAPDHYLCYDVKASQSFRRRKVAVTDQFGQGTYWVIRPRVLCVPAVKKHLD